MCDVLFTYKFTSRWKCSITNINATFRGIGTSITAAILAFVQQGINLYDGTNRGALFVLIFLMFNINIVILSQYFAFKGGRKMNFKDKVVVITGGTSGIGKQTAIEFSRKGAHVVAFTVDKEEVCKQAIKEIGNEAFIFTVMFLKKKM